jgi:hypothetical protein
MEAWVKKKPRLCLIITELFNILMHGMDAHAILFNLGGTLVNAAYIYGVLPTTSVLRGPLKRFSQKISDQLDVWADQLEAASRRAEVEAQKEAA